MNPFLSETERRPRVEVSVILATFNRPELLREALLGLTGQTGCRFEVIVVNDGGCDVASVVAEFRRALDIQYVPLEHNGGLPAARNAGCRVARGRYFAYLDDDDYYLPGHLAALKNRLDADSRLGLVYGDSLLLKLRSGGRGTACQRVLAFDYDHPTMLHDSFIAPSAVMHRRECYEASGGFDEALRWCYDDWDFLLRVGARFKIARVAGTSVVIRLRDDGSNMSAVARPERRAAAQLLRERHGTAEIEPKTFWEVAETLDRQCGKGELAADGLNH